MERLSLSCHCVSDDGLDKNKHAVHVQLFDTAKYVLPEKNPNFLASYTPYRKSLQIRETKQITSP